MTRAQRYFTKKHLIHTLLVILILLIALFILGDTSFEQVTRLIPTTTQTAAVSDFNSSLIAHYTFGSGTDSPDAGSTNELTTGLSVSFWVKNNTSSTGQQRFFSRGGTADGSGFFFLEYQFGNRLYFTKDGTTDLLARTSSNFGALPIGTWVHIVATWDGSPTATNVSFYRNGSLVSHDTNIDGVSLINGSALPFTPASSQTTAGSQLSDMRVYNKVLSSVEVQDLFAATPTGVTIETTPNPPPPAIDGVCGTTLNICTAGTLNNTPDTSSQYLWSCAGSNNGATASCSLPISTTPSDLPQDPPPQPAVDSGSPTLTVFKSYEGSGTVSGSGLTCSGKTCSVTKNAGTSVTLTASPDAGSVFLNWGGACSGNSPTCTLTLNASTVVTALFQTTAAMNGPTANNILEPGEVCDGSDLGGVTRIAGYKAGGTLRCRSDRTGYDVSGLTAGNTITAASCSSVHVQAAIKQAQDGDTVLVPPGTCEWREPVSIGRIFDMSIYNYILDMKSIVLRGSGIGVTTIVDKRSSYKTDSLGRTVYPSAALSISAATDKPVRITGFTFDGSGSISSQGPINAAGPPGAMIRIDHNKFANLTQSTGISFNTSYGLVDHNTFVQGAGSVTAVSISGDAGAAWNRPLSFGTSNAVYMEDNTFTFPIMIANGPEDAYDGARYVLRYNMIDGTVAGHHGYDSGGSGTFSCEIYNNTFRNTNYGIGVEGRSGTCVFYNNTANVPKMGYLALLRNYRSSDAYPVNYGKPWGYDSSNNTGICNGSTNPPKPDGNAPGMQGYPCKDQWGRTTGQALSPTYGWNNNINGKVGGSLIAGGYNSDALFAPWVDRIGIHVVEGRDFYNGIAKPGYVAYPYPHPLSQIDSPSVSVPIGTPAPAVTPPVTPPVVPPIVPPVIPPVVTPPPVTVVPPVTLPPTTPAVPSLISRILPSFTSPTRTPTTPSSVTTRRTTPSGPFVPLPEATPEDIASSTASTSFTEQIKSIFSYILERIWRGVERVVGIK